MGEKGESKQSKTCFLGGVTEVFRGQKRWLESLPELPYWERLQPMRHLKVDWQVRQKEWIQQHVYIFKKSVFGRGGGGKDSREWIGPVEIRPIERKGRGAGKGTLVNICARRWGRTWNLLSFRIRSQPTQRGGRSFKPG